MWYATHTLDVQTKEYQLQSDYFRNKSGVRTKPVWFFGIVRSGCKSERLLGTKTSTTYSQVKLWVLITDIQRTFLVYEI